MTVDEFRQAIRALPSLPDAERFTWLFRRKDIKRMILETNPEEFLTWPVIKESMFVGNAPYIQGMFDDIPSRILHSLDDPGFGKPELFDPSPYSGNIIVQAYHLLQWEKDNVRIRNTSSIAEFGAGYGLMTLVCRRLGFSERYTIIDLPEFALLQQYYLSNTIGTNGIEWSRGEGEYDLCIAICSLSEVDLETRNSLFERVRAKSYLIVFQPSFDGINNLEYFTQLRDDNPQLKWEMYSSPHYQNHWYLIGR